MQAKCDSKSARTNGTQFAVCNSSLFVEIQPADFIVSWITCALQLSNSSRKQQYRKVTTQQLTLFSLHRRLQETCIFAVLAVKWSPQTNSELHTRLKEVRILWSNRRDTLFLFKETQLSSDSRCQAHVNSLKIDYSFVILLWCYNTWI